jgi:hypothetical protein
VPKLVLEPLTVAEVVYVLSGIYGYSPERAKGELLALLTTGAVRLAHERAVLDNLSPVVTSLPPTWRRAGRVPGLSHSIKSSGS